MSWTLSLWEGLRTSLGALWSHADTLADFATVVAVVLGALGFFQWREQKNRERVAEAALNTLSWAWEVYVATERARGPHDRVHPTVKHAIEAKFELQIKNKTTVENLRKSLTLFRTLTGNQRASELSENLMEGFHETSRQLHVLRSGSWFQGLEKTMEALRDELSQRQDGDAKTLVSDRLDTLFCDEHHPELLKLRGETEELQAILTPYIQMKAKL